MIGGNFCWVCKSEQGLHTHEVFYGAEKQISVKYKMQVKLCGYHHNLSDAGIHFDRKLDFKLKKIAQERFNEMYPDLNFLKVFGKNYLGMTVEDYLRGRD